jgi:hypothetical protein
MWGLFPGTPALLPESSNRKQLLEFVTHPLAAECYRVFRGRTVDGLPDQMPSPLRDGGNYRPDLSSAGVTSASTSVGGWRNINRLSIGDMSLEPDYSSLFDQINVGLIEEIMVGAAIDPAIMIDSGKILRAAVHCCVNGPVGVNRPTNIPGIPGEIAIKSLFSKRVSNKTWRNFCYKVAGAVKNSLHPDQVARTQAHQVIGDLWPLRDWTA